MALNEWNGFINKLKDAVKLEFTANYSNGKEGVPATVTYKKGDVIACNKSIAEKYKAAGAKVKVIKFDPNEEIEKLEAEGRKREKAKK